MDPKYLKVISGFLFAFALIILLFVYIDFQGQDPAKWLFITVKLLAVAVCAIFGYIYGRRTAV